MTAYVEDLLTEALISAPGCPETLVERMLRQSAVDFYRDSKAWRVTTDVSPVIQGVREVELEVPSGTQVVTVFWVKLDGKVLSAASLRNLREYAGTPQAFAVDGLTGRLQLDVLPEQSYLRNGLIAHMALMPRTELTDLPSELYAAHRDGILYGAIARLLAMPNVAWSSLNDAQTYAGMASAIKMAARREADSLQAPVARKVRYGGIPI
jgi:hypothetical protein